MVTSLFKWLIPYALIGTWCNIKNVPNPSRLHPLYITVTEISFNSKEKILEISCKIFTNDFEGTLEKLHGTKIDLSAAADKPQTDRWVAAYIEDHLQLKVNGSRQVLQFVGSEKETDATWTYFQVNNISALNKCQIMNNLLYEAFEGQINIIHTSVNGVRKSTKLTNPMATATFDF